MSSVVGGAFDWLVERLQPSGDGVIRGLEQDLAREATLDGGWWRVRETAWALGFIELQLVPAPEAADLLAHTTYLLGTFPSAWLIGVRGQGSGVSFLVQALIPGPRLPWA